VTTVKTTPFGRALNIAHRIGQNKTLNAAHLAPVIMLLVEALLTRKHGVRIALEIQKSIAEKILEKIP
jgi:hypothetical protein